MSKLSGNQLFCLALVAFVVIGSVLTAWASAVSRRRRDDDWLGGDHPEDYG